MGTEMVSGWIQKAKSQEIAMPRADGVLVVRRISPENKGLAIMKIAETLFPWFMKMFEGDRDTNGMLMHPAKVRAIALNVAQKIVKEQE